MRVRAMPLRVMSVMRGLWLGAPAAHRCLADFPSPAATMGGTQVRTRKSMALHAQADTRVDPEALADEMAAVLGDVLQRPGLPQVTHAGLMAPESMGRVRGAWLFAVLRYIQELNCLYNAGQLRETAWLVGELKRDIQQAPARAEADAAAPLRSDDEATVKRWLAGAAEAIQARPDLPDVTLACVMRPDTFERVRDVWLRDMLLHLNGLWLLADRGRLRPACEGLSAFLAGLPQQAQPQAQPQAQQPPHKPARGRAAGPQQKR